MTLQEQTKPAAINDFTWWTNALKGEFGPVHDGDPQSGYYRVRRKGRDSDSPCAYWFDRNTGEQRCHVDGKDFDKYAMEIWPFASKKPISKEDYDHRLSTGNWRGESEAVTRSNNAPEDNSFEGFSAIVDDLVHEAEKIIAKGAASTQEEADRAADLADRLSKFAKRSAGELAMRDPEITPELKEAAERHTTLHRRWFTVVERTAIYKQIKAVVLTPFLNKKAEAEAKTRAEAAKAGVPLTDEPRATTKAGTRGRAVSLRTVKTVTIEDRAAVLAFFADGAAMTDFLQTLAERAVRVSVTVPGTKVTESKVAA